MSMLLNFDGPTSESCLIKNMNKTIIANLNLYEGIPQTLVLNMIAWIFLIFLFTLLRQQAWDYGRLALVNSNGEKQRWTQLFYAHGGNNEDFIESTERTATTINTNIDRGLLSWIWITFKLKKEQIKEQSGPDAYHYLSFQQHLMVVMSIITLISLIIILPVNFQGTLTGDINSFGHTTLSNLEPNSPLLWIHVIVAICFVPLIVLIMRRASGRNAGKKAPTRTIMATNVSRADCDKKTIQTYLQQLFPDIHITDIQLAYNIKELSNATKEYERTYEARIFCEHHRLVQPVQVKENCFKCQTIDALEYYQERERLLHGEVARLRAGSLNEPLGIAFISVTNTEAAQNVIYHFSPGTYRNWTLTYAPATSDIFWENLTNNSGQWYIKWAIINLCLFIVLFFLTTPVIVVNLLDTFSKSNKQPSEQTNEDGPKISPLISEFLATLLLWTLSAVMPVIVEYSERWMSHWTRSKQNYAIMTKSFGYLLLMILILPSLGLTSAQALLEWTLHYSENNTYRWECIFLPDKGAFFVNYVITAAFIGTALELIRFPELIIYTWQICTARSRAEHPHIRKSILTQFPFGIHYAWTIMVFTMSTVYSLACPLIMPFAMVYILMKHFVDRHNIYFAYGPSNMISQGGGKIHSTAVTMTKVSVIVLLIIMAALASVRGAGIDARAIVLIVSLCITLILFTFMSPIKRCTTKPITISDPDGPTPIYISDVLQKRIEHDDDSSSPSHFGYGSDSVDMINEAHNSQIRRTVST